MRALALVLLLTPSTARAWGERGHHSVAAAAARAVLAGARDADIHTEAYRRLRDFFASKAIELGHISHIPDTAWRGRDKLEDALNKPTHFADTDAWAAGFDQIPLAYEDALAAFQGKPSLLDGRPVDLFETGTLYWRAEELYELARGDFKRAAGAKPGSPEAHAALKEATLHLGLMAHFVADASMPLHNVTDWDSKATGNAGLHLYFETEAPLQAGPELETAIHQRLYAELGTLPDCAGSPRPAALYARELGKRARGQLLELRRLDDALLVERSTSAARRPHPSAGLQRFSPILEKQLALSAAALARLYRLAWEEGGRPELPTKLWDYHFKPDFVVPSYDPAAVERTKKRLAQ